MHPVADGAPHPASRSETEHIRLLEDLISTLWLTAGHAALKQLTTEQKELLADSVDSAGRARDPHTHRPFQRWWRTSASAATLRISLPEVASSYLQGAAAAAPARDGGYGRVVLGGSVCRIATAEFAGALVGVLVAAKVDVVELQHAAPGVAEVFAQVGAQQGVDISAAGLRAA